MEGCILSLLSLSGNQALNLADWQSTPDAQAKQVYVYDAKIQTQIDDLKHEILSSKSSASEPMARWYQRHDQDGRPAAALPTKEQVGAALAKVTTEWEVYHDEKTRLRADDSEDPKKKKQKQRQAEAE